MGKQMPAPQDEFAPDLNPEPQAGMNYGDVGPDTTEGTPASEMKDLTGGNLAGLSDAELKGIPVVPAGTRLEQGKTYINIDKLDEGEFTGMAYHEVGPDDRVVAKDAVDYDTWNKLRGREELTS